MNKIFTINFYFQEQEFQALVTVLSTDEELFYNVRVYDRALERLLPKNRMRYMGSDGYKDLSIINPLTEQLVSAIAEAIEEHLAQTECAGVL
jgi:hypothetical protein